MNAKNTLPTFIPGYRSKFGGLWPDKLNASDLLEQKLSKGKIKDPQADQVCFW